MNIQKRISEEVLSNYKKEYNEAEWIKIVNRFASYDGAQFYEALAQEGFDYNRIFCTYKTPEGIIFFKSVSYSSCLSGGGFKRVTIFNDGDVLFSKFFDEKGNEGTIANTPSNRKLMVQMSSAKGIIFTNEF